MATKQNAGLSEDTVVGMIVGPVFVVALLGFALAGAVVDAFVVVRYWRWFALPVFPALPALMYWQAVGLLLVVREILPRPMEPERENWGKIKDQHIHYIVRFIVGPLVMIAAGAILHAIIS